jgi:hypothetical protein
MNSFEEFYTPSLKKPKVGDLGFIKYGDESKKVAIVRHMIKPDVLCFFYALKYSNSENHDLIWKEVDPDGDLWKLHRKSSGEDIFTWIYNLESDL